MSAEQAEWEWAVRYEGDDRNYIYPEEEARARAAEIPGAVLLRRNLRRIPWEVVDE